MYQVEVLDANLNPVGLLKEFPPNSGDVWLTYGKTLSNYAKARFRVATRDPFVARGDVLVPYHNHIVIRRGGKVVWQGIVVNNPSRNKNYIEVEAYDYLYLLSKVLIQQDTAPKDTNFKQIDSGTMASTITTLITQAAANAPTGSIIKKIVPGQIDNPSFPQGFVDATGKDLSNQPWTWSSNFLIKYDYQDTLYVIESLSVYCQFEFELVWNGANLVFNFKKDLGQNRPGLVFDFRTLGPGTLDDFDVPLNGDRMANHLIGTAADNNFQVLKVDQSDTASIAKYGQVDGIAAYKDVKNSSLLKQRVAEELRIVADPSSAIKLLAKPSVYPIGTFNLGDRVTVFIDHYGVQVNEVRQVVGYEVDVHLTGYEQIKLTTNIPRAGL